MSNKVTYILELRDKYSKYALKIAASNEKLKRKITEVKAKIIGLSQTMKRKGADFGAYARKIREAGTQMALGFSLGFGLIAGSALKTTAEFEQMEIAITTLAGSAAKGGKLWSDLKVFAAKTPFEMKGLGKAAQTMIGMGGIAANKVVPALRMIGDLAAGTGAKVSALAYEYSQIRSKGKADAIDLKQLALRGFNVLKVVKEMAAEKGKIFSIDQLQKFASEGAITFEVVQAALKRVTGEGGRFHNMMKKQAETLAGVWSNFVDELDFAKDSIGRTLVEVFDLKNVIRELAEGVKKFAISFREFATEHPKLTKFALGFAAILAVAGPLLMVIGAIGSGVGVLVAGFSIVGPVFAAILSVMPALVAGFAAIAAVLIGISLPVWLIIGGIGLLLAAVYLLWDNWDTIWTKIGEGILYVAGLWDSFIGKIQAGGQFALKFLGLSGEGVSANKHSPSRAETTANNLVGGSTDALDITINAPEGIVEKVKPKSNSTGRRGRRMNVGVNNMAPA